MNRHKHGGPEDSAGSRPSLRPFVVLLLGVFLVAYVLLPQSPASFTMLEARRTRCDDLPCKVDTLRAPTHRLSMLQSDPTQKVKLSDPMSKVVLSDPTGKSTDRAQIFAVPSFSGDTQGLEPLAPPRSTAASPSSPAPPAAAPAPPVLASAPRAPPPTVGKSTPAASKNLPVHSQKKMIIAANNKPLPIQSKKITATNIHTTVLVSNGTSNGTAAPPVSINGSSSSFAASNNSRIVPVVSVVHTLGQGRLGVGRASLGAGRGNGTAVRSKGHRRKGSLVLSGEIASLGNASSIAIIRQLARFWGAASCAMPLEQAGVWRMVCAGHKSFIVQFHAGSVVVDFEADGMSKNDEEKFSKAMKKAVLGDDSAAISEDWGGHKLVSASVEGKDVVAAGNQDSAAEFDNTMQSAAVGLLVICMLVAFLGLLFSFYRHFYDI